MIGQKFVRVSGQTQMNFLANLIKTMIPCYLRFGFLFPLRGKHPYFVDMSSKALVVW